MSRQHYQLPLIVAFVIVSRAVFWTEHPPNFDFANFALGVERFDPLNHQPHPPGYPPVVLLARVFVATGFSLVRALYFVSLAGGIAAVLGAFWLARELAGDGAGLLAAALLAVEPAFWFSGVSSPTRPFLAAGVCWLLWACWRLARCGGAWLWWTAGLLAFVSGFRPELLALFAAPAILAARLGGASWGRILAGASLCLAASTPWMLFVFDSFESLRELVNVYYYYYLHHASTTSAFLGAPAGAWQGQLVNGLAWNALPAALATAGLLLRRESPDRRFLLLAGAYFLPAILVQLLIHQTADSPDHSLGTIAVLLVAGATLLRGRGAWLVAPAALAMLAVSFAGRGAASLRSFSETQRATAAAIEELRAALRPSDALIVLNDSLVSGRLLEWEFPRHIVLALDTAIAEPPSGDATGWRFFERRQAALVEETLLGIERVQALSNAGSAQRKLALERLCPPLSCRDLGWRVEASLGGWKGRVALAPYRFQLGL